MMGVAPRLTTTVVLIVVGAVQGNSGFEGSPGPRTAEVVRTAEQTV